MLKTAVLHKFKATKLETEGNMRSIKSGMSRSIYFLSLSMLAATSWGAALYKVVTPDGKVTYTDKAPAPGRANVIEMGHFTAVTTPPPPIAAATETRPTSTEKKEFDLTGVILFTSPGCKYCQDAKSFLDKRRSRYTEYDISTDRLAYDVFKQLGGKGVPLIVVNRRPMHGFNTRGLEELLKSANL